MKLKSDSLPYEQWKTYKVTYNTWYGENTTNIKAPNKTRARCIFNGEMNPNCKIISIVEVKK